MTKVVLLILLLSSSVSISAQVASDTLFIARSVDNAKALYQRNLRGESALYTGSDYAEYVPVGDEHPFFISNDWITGDLHYDNFLYKNIPLQYDISAQKLITEHLTSAKKIQVVHEKVGYFTLDSHKFVYLDETAAATFNEPAGFYELLVDGAARLYARRVKNLQRNVVAGKLEATFDEVTKYFVEKGGKFFPVKKKASVLAVLNDRKAELTKTLKRNHVRFSSTKRESALIETVRLYNNPGQ